MFNRKSKKIEVLKKVIDFQMDLIIALTETIIKLEKKLNEKTQ